MGLNFVDELTSKSGLNEQEFLKQEILNEKQRQKESAKEIDLEKRSKLCKEEPGNPIRGTEEKHTTFLAAVLRRISKTFHRPPTILSKGSKIVPKSAIKVVSKIVMFFSVLISVLKAVKLFRSRTKYRTLDNVTDLQLDLINDVSYVKRNKTDRKTISFVNNKFLRKTFRSFRIFFKHKKKYFIKIYSNC